jgi:hypothetical protein
MKSKDITYIFLAVIAILGWNAFLIKRDHELVNAYERKAAIERLKNPTYSAIKGFCKAQAEWHPDCNSK